MGRSDNCMENHDRERISGDRAVLPPNGVILGPEDTGTTTATIFATNQSTPNFLSCGRCNCCVQLCLSGYNVPTPLALPPRPNEALHGTNPADHRLPRPAVAARVSASRLGRPRQSHSDRFAPSACQGVGQAGDSDTALLVVWLHGGASHLETYDPKPLAPSEYRGPYRPIATRVPGMQISELLPHHARVARALHPIAIAGPHWSLSRQRAAAAFHQLSDYRQSSQARSSRPVRHRQPDAGRPGAAAAQQRRRAAHSRISAPLIWDPPTSRLPSLAIRTILISRCPNIGVRDRQRMELEGRRDLRQRLDQVSRHAEQIGQRDGFDAFQAQAGTS